MVSKISWVALPEHPILKNIKLLVMFKSCQMTHDSVKLIPSLRNKQVTFHDLFARFPAVAEICVVQIILFIFTVFVCLPPSEFLYLEIFERGWLYTATLLMKQHFQL